MNIGPALAARNMREDMRNSGVIEGGGPRPMNTETSKPSPMPLTDGFENSDNPLKETICRFKPSDLYTNSGFCQKGHKIFIFRCSKAYTSL